MQIFGHHHKETIARPSHRDHTQKDYENFRFAPDNQDNQCKVSARSEKAAKVSKNAEEPLLFDKSNWKDVENRVIREDRGNEVDYARFEWI